MIRLLDPPINTKLVSVNAHLGHRVAFPHMKVYICGSRNSISILDSDKTLICLRNALHFLGDLIRKKGGRFFLLETNNFFIYEIMDEMASSILFSQWKIGAFLNSPSKSSITNKRNLGFLRCAPDCVLIMDSDIQSSAIVEADRSQIPIVSLVDSTTPFRSFQKITYPIPANNSIQFVYLFANLLTKTQQQQRKLVGRRYYSASAKKKPESNSWIGRLTNKLFCTLPIGVIIIIFYHLRFFFFFVSLIQFIISQSFDCSVFQVLPDLNQTPPADEGTEPPVESAPPIEPLLQVIHDEIVAKLERKVRLQGPKYGFVVDASLMNEGARHVMAGLEIDPTNASDLLGLKNLLKTNSRQVDLIIKHFFEGKRNS
jgi:ribosomal protein S2